MSDEYTIFEETQNFFQKRLCKPKVKDRWYIPPRRTAWNTDTDNNFAAEVGETHSPSGWNRGMRRLENLHKKGLWREFYSEVNKLTKIKQGAAQLWESLKMVRKY